jgi:hypothetical protein
LACPLCRGDALLICNCRIMHIFGAPCSLGFYMSLKLIGSQDWTTYQFVYLFIPTHNEITFPSGLSIWWDKRVFHRLHVHGGWNKSIVWSPKQTAGMHVQWASWMTINPHTVTIETSLHIRRPP